MEIEAVYDGRAFVPNQPIECPVGKRVKVSMETEEEKIFPLKGLHEMLQQFPENLEAPSDRAAQVDHYLYGTPKRP